MAGCWRGRDPHPPSSSVKVVRPEVAAKVSTMRWRSASSKLLVHHQLDQHRRLAAALDDLERLRYRWNLAGKEGGELVTVSQRPSKSSRKVGEPALQLPAKAAARVAGAGRPVSSADIVGC